MEGLVHNRFSNSVLPIMQHLREVLRFEAVFHALAVAIVLQVLINGGDMREAVVNGGICSILGRVTPTEIIDRFLSIPLGKRKED